uniref:non-specific serine/threonine protein kinase n=1 Tax=Strigamia maritima TaxID=126957 RepID=T1IMB1_STRMM
MWRKGNTGEVDLDTGDTCLKLPEGQVLKDGTGQKWILGQVIGAGAYGEVYSGKQIVSDLYDGRHQLIFAEINLEKWRKKLKFKFLGMPKFISHGLNKINGIKYQFLVMERFGDDLQKFLTKSGNRFSDKTVVNLGIQILNVLEYLHGCLCVHNDVKALNIVVDLTCCDRVYLINFGLCKYYRWKYNGKLKTKKEYEILVPKHYGSLCFASRDGHDGVISRRGDLEALAYNLLLWSSGKLPWEKEATWKNRNVVQSSKLNYFEDVDKLFDECYGDTTPCPGLKEFFNYIRTLEYQDAPNYDGCRQFLKEGFAKTGIENNGKLDLNKVADDSTRLEMEPKQKQQEPKQKQQEPKQKQQEPKQKQQEPKQKQQEPKQKQQEPKQEQQEPKRKSRKRGGRTLNEQLPVKRPRRGSCIPIQSDDGNDVKGKMNRKPMKNVKRKILSLVLVHDNGKEVPISPEYCFNLTGTRTEIKGKI